MKKFQALETLAERLVVYFQPLEKFIAKVPTLGKTAPPEASPYRKMLPFKVGRTLRVSRLPHPTFHILLPTISVALLLLTGCAMLTPRHPVELDRVPQAARPAPERFNAIQSVVFSFYGRSMTGIGVLSLDRAARSFDLSCMTPMGTKLFDLRMVNGVPEVLFALPFLTEKEGFGETVARDIARIYFDSEPPQITRAYRKRDVLWIESEVGEETLAYGYVGDPLVLNEKRVFRGRALEARIEYRQFFEQDGFRCIGEAKLKSEYGYRLTVRTKELTIKQ